MSQFIGTSMSTSFAGALTRGFFDHTVEVHPNDGTVAAVGVPVKLKADGNLAALTANTDVVYGFVVREYGQVGADGSRKDGFLSVLRRGYIAVKSAGTPAIGGVVYLAADGTLTAEKGSNTALTGAQFMGPADADGVVEIAFNI